MYNEKTKDDPDYIRFDVVHPTRSHPSPIWRVTKSKPLMKDKCFDDVNLIALSSPQEDDQLVNVILGGPWEIITDVK